MAAFISSICLEVSSIPNKLTYSKLGKLYSGEKSVMFHCQLRFILFNPIRWAICLISAFVRGAWSTIPKKTNHWSSSSSVVSSPN